MGKRREKHPFEDNPFVEGFLEWMGSPEGQRRELIRPEAQRLSLAQSTQRIQKEYPHFPRERIESFLISWLEHYAPESYSQEQLDALDQLTEQWIADLERRPQTTHNPERTRDS